MTSNQTKPLSTISPDDAGAASTHAWLGDPDQVMIRARQLGLQRLLKSYPEEAVSSATVTRGYLRELESWPLGEGDPYLAPLALPGGLA